METGFLAQSNFWLQMPFFSITFLALGQFFMHQKALKQYDSEPGIQDDKKSDEIGTRKWTGWQLAVHYVRGCNLPTTFIFVAN